jgi:Fe2+ or Zn2+ uptake regulation protein
MNAVEKKSDREFTERLNRGGFRFTPQRQQVSDALLHKRNHPTAEEVFTRAKKQMPEISRATVYNCLDALVECGLVRQVQLDAGRRGSVRTCPGTAIFIAAWATRFMMWICRQNRSRPSRC